MDPGRFRHSERRASEARVHYHQRRDGQRKRPQAGPQQEIPRQPHPCLRAHLRRPLVRRSLRRPSQSSNTMAPKNMTIPNDAMKFAEVMTRPPQTTSRTAKTTCERNAQRRSRCLAFTRSIVISSRQTLATLTPNMIRKQSDGAVADCGNYSNATDVISFRKMRWERGAQQEGPT